MTQEKAQIMHTLSLDLETYSDVDLPKCGVYKYVESRDFQILILAYAFDDEPVQVVDMANGEDIPQSVLDALQDVSIIKCAWNANFERTCLSHYLNYQLQPEGWHCSMVHALSVGLPASLKNAGTVLRTDIQKDKRGEALIRYFSLPCKPTAKNGMRTRNLPAHDLEGWKTFKEYCRTDVATERAIRKILDRMPMPEEEWKAYCVDQRINDRGVLIDRQLVNNAIIFDGLLNEEMTNKAYALTGLDNPNSVSQLKRWIAGHGITVDSLGKKDVETMIASLTKSGSDQEVLDMLKLRLKMAKSSVKKYEAAERCMCRDDRVRGLFAFYGASHTGRFSSRYLQLQNLKRNDIPTLDEARELVKTGQYAEVEKTYGNAPEVLSQLVRTMLIPKDGCEFIVADYSAIEARVLAWEAGEEWSLNAFRKGEDLYCATASAMFHKPVVKHGINGELRQKGKIATLACIAEGQLVLTNHGLIPIQDVSTDDLVWDGEDFVHHDGVIYKGEKEVITYQGLTATPDHLVYIEGKPGPVRFEKAAASGAHLIQTSPLPKTTTKIKAEQYVGKRKVYDILNAGQHHRFTVSGKLVHNCGYQGGVGALKAMGALSMGIKESELPEIISQWRAANSNIVQYWYDIEAAAKDTIENHKTNTVRKITFQYYSGTLWMILPSGRKIAYLKPALRTNRDNGRTDITYEGITTGNHWDKINLYGGLIVENATQAIARDILVAAMKRFDALGIDIVAHIHDEVILEVPKNKYTVDEITAIMCQKESWYEDLPLNADGYKGNYYFKS